MALLMSARNMGENTAQSLDPNAWWVRGDAPVRVASTLMPLVDGRAAMLAMCVAFLTARESIWLAGWDVYARLRMVRGKDQRAGPDGSSEQYALVDQLRAAGLDREAIRLWESGGLRVVDVLGFAARRGVRVHFLLWGPFNPGGFLHLINAPKEQQRLFEAHGIECRLDTSNRSPLHVAQALHQKCAVVDSQTAFLGGIDLTVQYDGDFDRWDTLAHPFESEQRSTNLGAAPHPWHDGHLMLTGAPAADAERNIRQRWDEANLGWWHQATPPLRHLVKLFLSGSRDSGQRAAGKETEGALPPGTGPEVSGQPARVQVIRTIPALTYRFAPAGVHGIAQAYTLVARQAQRFIYLETQYFWLENYIGFNTTKLGWQSHHMRAFVKELAAAAERGVSVAVVLPDHPNVGRAMTDATIRWLRKHAPQASAAGRLHFFCLGASEPRAQNGFMRYRPIYVHAKVGMVDDLWATIGSANLNSRGLSHDAELNLAVLDSDFARGLRLALWAEHAGALGQVHTGWPAPAMLPLPQPLVAPPAEGVLTLVQPTAPWHTQPPGDGRGKPGHAPTPDKQLTRLEDPLEGIKLLERQADENLERLRRGEPFVGHCLPYLCAEEGEASGLEVDNSMGLLDPLRAVREGVRVRHPSRYT